MAPLHAEWSALAGRMGLRFRPAALPGRIGELNGILRGHRVLVRPDRPALFVEYRFRVAGLRLSTAPPRTGAADAFATGDAAFDRAFPERRASPAAQGALRTAVEVRAGLLALLRRPRPRGVEVTLDDGQLLVRLRRPAWARRLLGRRGTPAPVEVEPLLADMLSIVETLEAALRDHALRVAAGAGNGRVR